MQSYQEMSKEELLKEKEHLEAEYKKFQQRGLKLDMSRGKAIPGTAGSVYGHDGCSLVLFRSRMRGMERTAATTVYWTESRRRKCWIGDMIECNPENIIIYGNSSLNIMYDTISTLHDTRCDGKYAVVQA